MARVKLKHNILKKEYVFDVTNNKLIFQNLDYDIHESDILLIRIVQNTKERTIYTGASGKGGTWNDVTKELVFDLDVTSNLTTDTLQVYVEVPEVTDKTWLGNTFIKMLRGMLKVVTTPFLWEVGEHEVPNHIPKVVQGYNPALPSLVEADISELLVPKIPLIPIGGIGLHVVSTSPLDFDETLATGSLTLTGSGGTLDTLSVNAVQLISTPIPFNTDIDTTYDDIATNIHNHTSGYEGNKEVTILLSGTSGTTDITMGSVTSVAIFNTSLIVTANNFIITNRIDFLAIGISVTTTGVGDLIFTPFHVHNNTPPTFVTGGIVTLTGDLNGTITSLLKIHAPIDTGITPNGFVVSAITTILTPITTNMIGGVIGGTGIRKAHIEYLLLDGTCVTDIISLNGTTNVIINNNNLNYAVNDLHLFTAGILGVAQGDIQVQDAGLVIYKVIKVGEVQDRTCLYTVPKGLVAVLSSFSGGALVGKESMFRLKANAMPMNVGLIPLKRGSYHSFDTPLSAKDGRDNEKLEMPYVFPELTDIKMTGVDLGGGLGVGIAAFKFYTEPK